MKEVRSGDPDLKYGPSVSATVRAVVPWHDVEACGIGEGCATGVELGAAGVFVADAGGALPGVDGDGGAAYRDPPSVHATANMNTATVATTVREANPHCIRPLPIPL